MKLLVVGQAVEDLLLGFVANGAGVVENQPGFFDGGDLAIALGQQCTDDFLGVVHVHLAAKDFEIKGSLSFSPHRNSSIAPRGRQRRLCADRMSISVET